MSNELKKEYWCSRRENYLNSMAAEKEKLRQKLSENSEKKRQVLSGISQGVAGQSENNIVVSIRSSWTELSAMASQSPPPAFSGHHENPETADDAEGLFGNLGNPVLNAALLKSARALQEETGVGPRTATAILLSILRNNRSAVSTAHATVRFFRGANAEYLGEEIFKQYS